MCTLKKKIPNLGYYLFLKKKQQQQQQPLNMVGMGSELPAHPWPIHNWAPPPGLKDLQHSNSMQWSTSYPKACLFTVLFVPSVAHLYWFWSHWPKSESTWGRWKQKAIIFCELWSVEANFWSDVFSCEGSKKLPKEIVYQVWEFNCMVLPLVLTFHKICQVLLELISTKKKTNKQTNKQTKLS